MVFLGSASVWIEGFRAARTLVDITNHCIFSARTMLLEGLDIPLGPFIGMTVTGSSNVLIGGMPMPSLVSMAIGAATKALGKGLGKAASKIRTARAAKAAARATKAEDEAASKTGTGGLENRGYRPKPGERTMTRQQWKEQYRQQRVANKGLENRGTRPKPGLAYDARTVPRDGLFLSGQGPGQGLSGARGRPARSEHDHRGTDTPGSNR